eukprot:scaffold29659_cov112-Isochrysis_galbana.AAC.7
MGVWIGGTPASCISRSDSCTEQSLQQPVRVVKGVPGVGDALAGKLGSKADAGQRVERVEKLDRAALEVDRLGDLDRVEDEQALQKVDWHVGDERILADEGRHDGARGHHRHPLLEQDLLESAGVVVGVAVGQDDVRDLPRRDAVQAQVVRRVGRRVHQDPVAAHP